MILLALLALLLTFPCNCALGQTESASTDRIPVLTVCEALQDLSAYNNKSLIVIGRFVKTSEGTWITDDCERKIVTDGYTWDNLIWAVYIAGVTEPPPSLPANFHWDNELLMKKAVTSKDYNKYPDHKGWIAMFGRLEAKIPPEAYKNFTGEIRGRGFGHLGGAIAQFISQGSDCVYSLEEPIPLPARKGVTELPH
jgi:hypothetical protein